VWPGPQTRAGLINPALGRRHSPGALPAGVALLKLPVLHDAGTVKSVGDRQQQPTAGGLNSFAGAIGVVGR
jgi:hypothetical protein